MNDRNVPPAAGDGKLGDELQRGQDRFAPEWQGTNVSPRTFRIIEADDTPIRALTWRSTAERNRVLAEWRRAVFGTFGQQNRCLRLAWVLSDLFHRKGYAYASDLYLANLTEMPRRSVQFGLQELDGSAIIRVHVKQPNGDTERRIFPSRELLPHVCGERSPPRYGANVPPYVRLSYVQNLNRKTSLPKELLAARQANALKHEPEDNHSLGAALDLITERAR